MEKTSSEGVMAPVQARGKYREVCKGLHSGGGGGGWGGSENYKT